LAKAISQHVTDAADYAVLHPDESILSIAEKYHADRQSITRELKRRGAYDNRRSAHSPTPAMMRARREMSAFIEKAYSHICLDNVVKLPKGKPCKIVLIDDQHVPFTDWQTVEDVVKYDGDADLVCTHELINFDAFSRFLAETISDPLSEEVLACRLLEYWAEHIPRVVVGSSNHMERVDKCLASCHDITRLEYLRKVMEPPLKSLAEKHPRIQRIRSHVLRIGPVAFSHFDRYRGKPGDVAEDALRFLTHASVSQMSLPPPELSVSGHTHRFGFRQAESARALVAEVGSSAHYQPYATNPAHLTAAAIKWAQMQAYFVVVLDKQHQIDWPRTHPRMLRWSTVPAEASPA